MCSKTTMSAIETVVSELVRMRHTFTGHDVHARIHNKHVRRTNPLPDCPESPHEISQDVRKMFNTKHPAFAEYGSAIVQHDNGPVLYFALPHHAKIKARKIAAQLAPPAKWKIDPRVITPQVVAALNSD